MHGMAGTPALGALCGAVVATDTPPCARPPPFRRAAAAAPSTLFPAWPRPGHLIFGVFASLATSLTYLLTRHVHACIVFAARMRGRGGSKQYVETTRSTAMHVEWCHRQHGKSELSCGTCMLYALGLPSLVRYAQLSQGCWCCAGSASTSRRFVVAAAVMLLAQTYSTPILALSPAPMVSAVIARGHGESCRSARVYSPSSMATLGASRGSRPPFCTQACSSQPRNPPASAPSPLGRARPSSQPRFTHRSVLAGASR